MVLEYAYQKFDKSLVEMSALGLDFDLHARYQFYKGPIPKLSFA